MEITYLDQSFELDTGKWLILKEIYSLSRQYSFIVNPMLAFITLVHPWMHVECRPEGLVISDMETGEKMLVVDKDSARAVTRVGRDLGHALIDTVIKTVYSIALYILLHREQGLPGDYGKLEAFIRLVHDYHPELAVPAQEVFDLLDGLPRHMVVIPPNSIIGFVVETKTDPKVLEDMLKNLPNFEESIARPKTIIRYSNERVEIDGFRFHISYISNYSLCATIESSQDYLSVCIGGRRPGFEATVKYSVKPTPGFNVERAKYLINNWKDILKKALEETRNKISTETRSTFSVKVLDTWIKIVDNIELR